MFGLLRGLINTGYILLATCPQPAPLSDVMLVLLWTFALFYYVEKCVFASQIYDPVSWLIDAFMFLK